MELFLQNGDYLPDGNGGFVRATGGEEILQRVLFKLTARKGAFPLLPELGSRLYTLPQHKPEEWSMLARQYVTEALADEDSLNVVEVAVAPEGEGAAVEVTLEYSGETWTLTVEL